MNQPLADRIRPGSLSELIGQDALVKPGSPLRRMISGDFSRSASIILHGPPGSGKTTIARLISKVSEARFLELSAISATVAQVREVIVSAKREREVYDRPTVLFLDEIHRFSKSQQDSLLGAVESGTIILVAATTENPSFSIIKPLVSRSLVMRLEPLDESSIREILNRALETDAALMDTVATAEAIDYLAQISSGDARRALTLLESAAALSNDLGLEEVKQASTNAIAYDAKGDVHYDTISAFIKSIRGSDVNAALHYLARMIVGGEDPGFIARRLIILASEDIGLADPQAIVIAEAVAGTVERIGMPEGRIPLAQATVYMALAPKSNRAYDAINRAISDVEQGRIESVPAHLRSTGAVGYRYPHDSEAGIVQQRYADVPSYYEPSERGFERTLGERLKLISNILFGSDKK